MRLNCIEPVFVDFIPSTLQPGKLYICTEYQTSSHLCCCGCGREVVNPLTPTGWSLVVRGGAVWMSQSIGNSSFPCKSHYWIEGNDIIWESKMSIQLTAAARARDRAVKHRYYAGSLDSDRQGLAPSVEAPRQRSFMRWLRQFFS